MTVKTRIRYVEQPGVLLAIVQQKRGLFGPWRDTKVVERIDMRRVEQSVRAVDAKNGNTAGWDDTAGFGDRLKKVARKIAKSKVVKVVAKAHTAPIKWANKVTHGKNSPIRKAELAVQGAVTKALPFTKPFIAFHNKAANQTQKLMARADMADAKKRVEAAAIVAEVKKLPPAQREAAQKELVKRAKQYVVESPTGASYRFDF